ncbi:MAG: L,D-transpeptidase [Longimicrobiales bacterium]
MPRSAGCIRMRNKDVIELFGHVSVGTAVNIREQELSKSLRQQRKSTKRR